MCPFVAMTKGLDFGATRGPRSAKLPAEPGRGGADFLVEAVTLPREN